LSQKPHRCRSWAPRGKTPVLQFNFNWDKLSVSAGLTLRNFYFRLYPGAIRQAHGKSHAGGVTRPEADGVTPQGRAQHDPGAKGRETRKAAPKHPLKRYIRR